MSVIDGQALCFLYRYAGSAQWSSFHFGGRAAWSTTSRDRASMHTWPSRRARRPARRCARAWLPPCARRSARSPRPTSSTGCPVRPQLPMAAPAQSTPAGIHASLANQHAPGTEAFASGSGWSLDLDMSLKCREASHVASLIQAVYSCSTHVVKTLDSCNASCKQLTECSRHA